MPPDEELIAQLFALAQKNRKRGSLARNLPNKSKPNQNKPRDGDISDFAQNLKKTDSENNISRDILHYSYGL